jgi:hypothetical protein
MKTKKLKKNITKKSKTHHNKSSKRIKMMGGTKSAKESSRRSPRGLEIEAISVVNLGRGSPESPSYNDQTLSESQIKKFVETKIKPGYQIVCFPMPPDESHSIVVELVPYVGAMISDWGGEKNRQPKRSAKDKKKWHNYIAFIKYLEETYGAVSYYPVDEAIDQIACKRYETNHGQGGCSEYVHNWINVHIGKGKKAILFIKS